MSAGLISVGTTGIRAAQLGLMTAEHNITNANTPGFSRQRIIQTTNAPVGTGAGFVGQGTNVSSIERLYSRTLVNQVNTAQASVGSLEQYYTQIKQIDNLLADANSGLSPALQDFFRGVQSVSSNPSMLAARQSMISSAEALVARFQSMEVRMNELYEGVGVELKSTVDNINAYAQQVAELNQRIVLAQASSPSLPNDLLDQRDQLVNELNNLIGVTARVDSDGSYNIFYGNGQQLVIGNQVSELVVQAASSDITRMVVGVRTPGGVQELPESMLTGGSLSGLLSFRRETLDRSTNDIGRIAATLALTFNAQNELGQDLLGQVVGEGSFASDFFTVSDPQVIANTLNTGTGAVGASLMTPSVSSSGEFYTNLSNSDYRLTRTAAGYTMTRLTDNQAWSDPSLATLSTTVSASEGFDFSLVSGAINVGDSFTLMPTKFAARNIAVGATVASDPRLIAAAMPLRTASDAVNSGNAQISAGATQVGFSAASIPVGGLTITYASGSGEFTIAPASAGFSVTAGGTTTAYAAGAPFAYSASTGATITLAGMNFSISGTPNNGDAFTVTRNQSGVSDGRNALALGKLQTQNTVAGGTANYQVAYARLVSDVGNKTREIQVTGQAQSSLLKQAQNARDSLSGVNLDEEAANLLRYQQAYQASAKALDIGNKLFDVILALRS
ncbi:MAG: flagellar hook-associated protein FlgK [Betaproteobacteria bacterium]|nr:flagellar hook-associated protein FlgK [Betaproteobacteria bacterium]